MIVVHGLPGTSGIACGHSRFFILFQGQSALRNTFYIGAVGKTIPTIQLGNDLSATVLRYLRLQEQKQLVETRVKTLDAEMQRLKGRIVAKLNISCMAMGEYVTMSESRRFPHSKLAKLLHYNGSDLNSIGRRTGVCLFDYGMTPQEWRSAQRGKSG